MAQQTGAIYHQGILYSGGGGTEVIPNPQGEATDTLNTVEIDGTVYGIEGGGGSNLILDAQRYSLDEQVVGIWTDGKPLYQKTIHIPSLPSTAYTITTYPHGIQDIDTICGWDSVVRWSTGSIRIIPSTQYVNRSENIAGCFDATITKTGIEIWVGQDRSALNGDFTIWYTKTTDTAGSGGYQAYGFSPIIFSDKEREIGVWRDNKPLYQKTIDIGTLPNAGQKLVNHNISDFGEVVRVFGYARNTSNNASIPLPHTHPNGANQSTSLIVTTTQISVQTGTDRSGYAGYVTIQYTKASDTAGSSKYNTLAIPNVHYSTDEQVIGTWIDGKPIYQKTLVYSSGYDIGSSPITLPTTDFPEFSSVKIFINGHAYRETTSDRGTACVDIGVWKDGSSFKVQAPDTWRIMTHFTVQYTKTTD